MDEDVHVKTKSSVTNVQAIKLHFEGNGGRKVSMEELKALPKADREELGALCAKELGLTIEVKPTSLNLIEQAIDTTMQELAAQTI